MDRPCPTAAGAERDRRLRRRHRGPARARALRHLGGHARGRRRRVQPRHHLPGRAGLHRRRPVPAHADPRRARPPPHPGGQARAAVERPRRARPRPRRRPRHVLHGLGAERPRRARRRRLQQLGRPGPRDALDGRQRHLGAVRAWSGRGHDLQVRDARAPRRVGRQGRSDGAVRGSASGDRLGRHGIRIRLERRRLDDHARLGTAAVRPDVGVRAAPRVVATRSVLPRRGRAADRVRHRAGLHARRVHAARRAPVRRLLGLPGDRLLRSDEPLRAPRRAAPADRPPAPGRHRRDHGLGTRPLPEGRLRPGALRRRTAVRARRPAARRAQGLGHPDLRLRPQRGAQLPRRERAVLVRGVPRRRSARGCRGLDALPRLLARARRMGAQHPRRAREPRGDRLPAGGQRHRLQARTPAS